MKSSQLKIWRAIHSADYADWMQFWRSWPEREITAHPDYVRLYADPPSHEACCACWQSGASFILYPFLLRDITSEVYWDSQVGPAADIITPYGYGGPFCFGNEDRQELSNSFWEDFDRWAASNHVVSEFVRFGLFPEQLAAYPGVKVEAQQNVVCRLDRSREDLEMSFRPKVRRNLKRARRAGVRVEVDCTGETADDFLSIYYSTMERRNASSGYYFPREFFEQLSRDLSGHFAFFHALVGEEVISTELVLLSANKAYFFLGGTESRFFESRANELLKYEIMCWLSEKEVSCYVLGGGYRPEDGVFQYKKAFAPDGIVPFYTGRRILNPVAYTRLVGLRGNSISAPCDDDFFPKYRAA